MIANLIHFQTVHLDPCLDDCVMFAKKLKKLGNSVGIEVLEGLPHGFLNFSLVRNPLYTYYIEYFYLLKVRGWIVESTSNFNQNLL